MRSFKFSLVNVMLDQFVYIFSHILGPLDFLHAKLCLPFGSMTSLHLHSSGWQRVEPSRRLQAMCKDIWSKRKPRDRIGCMETKNLSFCSWENPSVRSGLTFAILLPNGFNYLVLYRSRVWYEASYRARGMNWEVLSVCTKLSCC